jgi:hypothetical protein
MPDRIIKESCCTSDTLAMLSDFEERFWWRLTVNCDDFGRCYARPAILKSKLFPLMESKTHKDMSRALTQLASVGLVQVYEVDGRPFLQVVKWDKHQRIRAKRSKFPSPDDSCQHLTADDSKCPRNPIQSNPNMNPNPNPDSTEQKTAPVPPAPPVYTLPLNDGTEWELSQEQYNEYLNLYPAVDVMCELRKMRGWLNANPERRKTKRGINSFVNRWLSKEQDRAKNPGTAPKKPQTRFHNFEQRQDDSDEEMALAMMRNRLK